MQVTRIAGQLQKLCGLSSTYQIILQPRINSVPSSSFHNREQFVTANTWHEKSSLYIPCVMPVRCVHLSSSPCQQKVKPQPRDIVESRDKRRGEVTIGKKVAQAGKDASYIGIIIVGVGITGLMFYVVGRELFSGQSPSGVYGKAFKACRKNEELTCALGTPLKGYGEMTRRGRRRHVNHTEFERDGVPHMRMKFYVEGPDGKGTANLEVKKNESGSYEYRYLFVETNDYPRRTFVIVDHR